MSDQPTHVDGLTRSSSSKGRSDTALSHDTLRDNSPRGRTLDILSGNEVSRGRDRTVKPRNVIRDSLGEEASRTDGWRMASLSKDREIDVSPPRTPREAPERTLQPPSTPLLGSQAQFDSPQEPTTSPTPQMRFNSPTQEGEALSLAGPSTTSPEKRDTMPSDNTRKLRPAPKPPIIDTKRIDEDVASFAKNVGMFEHAKIIENHASQLQEERKQRLEERKRQWRLSQEKNTDELSK